MAIKLNDGFKNLKVGKNQLLRIRNASEDNTDNSVIVVFEDAAGGSQRETYRLTKKAKVNGKIQRVTNDAVLSIFSTLAKTALRDWNADDIEASDLIGRYIIGTVTADEVEGEDGTKRTFMHVRNFSEADCDFNGEPLDDSEDEELFDVGE